MLSPLCATAFVTTGVQFSYFFSVSLSLQVLNAVSLFFAFWRDPEHAALNGRTFAAPLQSETASIELGSRAEGETGTPTSSAPTPAAIQERMTTAERNKAMLKSKVVWLVGLFLFFYVG